MKFSKRVLAGLMLCGSVAGFGQLAHAGQWEPTGRWTDGYGPYCDGSCPSEAVTGWATTSSDAQGHAIDDMSDCYQELSSDYSASGECRGESHPIVQGDSCDTGDYAVDYTMDYQQWPGQGYGDLDYQWWQYGVEYHCE